jgi:hypothetical protein
MIFLNFSLNLGKGTTYRASAVNALKALTLSLEVLGKMLSIVWIIIC